jgi:mannose-1-phosphate guanylyltransferase
MFFLGIHTNQKQFHMSNTYVAIMAGGVGSRFWPGSREQHPKQFLDMMGMGKSLLRLTFERFLPLCPAANIFVVTNAIYKDLVKQQIPELTDNQILCEPSRNNTAPCVAYTAFKLANLDPKATMVIAPSDHIILKESIFIEKISNAVQFAAQNEALVTLGIQPSRPDTGYGYIHFDANETSTGIHKVQRFAEKPDVETAQAFLASGEYLWNAGIFIWSVESVLKAFQTLSPDIFNILAAGEGHYNTPNEQNFIDTAYPTTPNISVDFAIMEKAQNVFTIPAEFGWSDLGTWASLYAISEKDAANNVVLADQALLYDVRDCIVRAPAGKLIVLKDLQNYILIDEPDVLLLVPKDKEQEIKQITAAVKSKFGGQYL